MPLWVYGYFALSCLYGLWHGGKTIRARKSSLLPRLGMRHAVLVGWLEILANTVVLVLALIGIALHVTYP
jgi:hypothetical protein